MKDRSAALLILLEVLFSLAAVSPIIKGNFQTMAQTVSDFPIEQPVWERTGPLIHYDWGLSAYIYLDNNNLYYMIAGGSEFYAIWISLDPNDSDGFRINGMSVDYVLSTVGPEDRISSSAGLHKWAASEEKWKPTVIANVTDYSQNGIVRRSSDGSIAFSANQGKVALSRIGNPGRIWLVMEANESGPIRVPQNGFAYLDITNVFAAVFMIYKGIGPVAHPGTAFPPEPQSWVMDRFETANATILLKNYGQNLIQNIHANMSVPPEVRVLNGTLDWSTSVGPEKTETYTVQINRTCFGTSIVTTSLTYNVGETETVSLVALQQRLTMAPRVDLDIMAPQEELLWMQHYQVNLTIANLDPYAATVDLKPSSLAYVQEHDVITLTLNPLANTTLHPRVKIKGGSIGFAVFFEEIKLVSATAPVDFTYPRIWIREVSINDEQYTLGRAEIEVGKMHSVQGTIQNEENASYLVTVALKEGSYTQELSTVNSHFTPNYSTQAAELPPNSNKTITFHIFALDKLEIGMYTKLSLSIEIDQTYLRDTEVPIELLSEPEPLLTPEIVLLCALMFLIGVFAKVIYDATLRKRDR